MSRETVYLVPGLFGFTRLAGYEYFGHLAELLRQRLRDLDIVVVGTLPTASVRRRANQLSRQIEDHEDGSDRPIHLIGHSTGGLECRLLLSPGAKLRYEGDAAWRRRVRSVITLSTPHYGTPTAEFFTSSSGNRILYGISLLTVTALSLGRPGLAALTHLVSLAGSLDDLAGAEIHLLDRSTDAVLRFIDEEGRGSIRDFLHMIREDRGGVYQVIPECMDLFNSTAIDNPEVRYGSVAMAARRPGLGTLKVIRSPISALTASLYASLWTITSRGRPIYPYADAADSVSEAIGMPIDERANDGVVPTLSMVWGELLWAGIGDHLDVIGHFGGRGRADWMCSGTEFDERAFNEMGDRLADFIQRSD